MYINAVAMLCYSYAYEMIFMYINAVAMLCYSYAYEMIFIT